MSSSSRGGGKRLLPRSRPECDSRCRSKKDAEVVVCAVSKGSDLQSLALLALGGVCARPGRASDGAGRTALQMASARGKRRTAEWLVTFRDAAVNAKDHESGYSALHRAAFHGQVHLAEYLVASGANLSLSDGDGLSPLDHLVRDRMESATQLDLTPNNPCELYTWGSNANFNLGLGHQQQRHSPEVLEVFRREGVFCRAAALQKFHSAFLSSSGQVFTCGHGRGGRLGHGDEESQLTPKQVRAFQGQSCSQVALGVDHSVFLLSSGAVWTCGTNNYHQLGQALSLKQAATPAPVSAAWKGGAKAGSGGTRFPAADGVCAARFHSLFWTREALYTWGLNAGQLGHIRGERTVSAPKLVSSLNEKRISIRMVACSDGAVVVLTEGGELLALHEYQNRRIASRHHDVAKIVVTGGHLDPKVCSSSHSAEFGTNDKIVEKGGQDLKVYLLTNLGRVLVWEEKSGSQFCSCVFSLNREMLVADIAVSRSQILLLSKDGVGYEGTNNSPKRYEKKVGGRERKKEQMTELGNYLSKNPTELVKVKRIPGIFRGTAVAADPKGQNFCVLQLLASASLTALPEVDASTMSSDMGAFLEEVSEADLLHDVVFRVGDRLFPAHKYVVACASDLLSNRLVALGPGETEVEIHGMQPAIFEQLLKFAYTRTCDLLRPGPCLVPYSSREASKDNPNPDEVKEDDLDERQSAFAVREKRNDAKRRSREKASHNVEEDERRGGEDTAHTALQRAAQLLGFHGLLKPLENVRVQNGVVVSTRDPKVPVRRSPPPCFSRKSFPELHDVSIVAEDGSELSAHRCVLAARLDYFRSMFGLGWSESDRGRKVVLALPLSPRVVAVLLDYIYRDEPPPALVASEDPEFLGSVLVAADQFLVPRLIQVCERQLAQLLTLRNAAEILQFAQDLGSAVQIRESASQFVCQNLAPLLESRALSSLEDRALESLTAYYQQEFLQSVMERRVITPWSGGRSLLEMEEVLEANPSLSAEDIFEDERLLAREQKEQQQQRQHHHQQQQGSSSKRRSGRKNSSGEKAPTGVLTSRQRNLSSCSLSSGSSDCSTDGDQAARITGKDNRLGSNLSLEELDFEEKEGEPFSGGRVDRPPVARPLPSNGSEDFLADFFGTNKVGSPHQKSPVAPSEQNVPFSKKKFAKKSQKERKRERVAETLRTLAPSTVEVEPKSPPKWGGWGPGSPSANLNDVPSKDETLHSLPSFSDIMKSQASTSSEAPPNDTITTNNNTNNSKPKRGRKSSWRQLDLSAESDIPTSPVPTTAWKTATKTACPAPAPPVSVWNRPAAQDSFRGIQDDQSRRSEKSRRVQSKPLSVTQTEERAIQELGAFYNAAGVFDEHITVVRAHDGPMEVPVWKRL